MFTNCCFVSEGIFPQRRINIYTEEFIHFNRAYKLATCLHVTVESTVAMQLQKLLSIIKVIIPLFV